MHKTQTDCIQCRNPGPISNLWLQQLQREFQASFIVYLSPQSNNTVTSGDLWNAKLFPNNLQLTPLTTGEIPVLALRTPSLDCKLHEGKDFFVRSFVFIQQDPWADSRDMLNKCVMNEEIGETITHQEIPHF